MAVHTRFKITKEGDVSEGSINTNILRDDNMHEPTIKEVIQAFKDAGVEDKIIRDIECDYEVPTVDADDLERICQWIVDTQGLVPLANALWAEFSGQDYAFLSSV